MRSRTTDLPPARPHERLKHWSLAFRWVFVLFIVWASAQTALGAHTAGVHAAHSPLMLVLLAGAEILGALLFLLRPTQLAGLVILLIVFAVATIMSLLIGDMPLRFLYYSATALFILAVDRSTRMEAHADAD